MTPPADRPGWLPRQRGVRRLLVAGLLLSALCRGVLLVEFVREDVGFDAHPARDMHHYLRGAERILAGDLALVGSIEEFHLGPDIMGPGEMERLNRTRAPLTQAPLYFYCLAGARLLWDGTLLPVRIVQLGAGLLIAWLTFLLVREATRDERIGAAAALLAAFHPTSVLYQLYLLRDTLVTLLTLLFVLALARSVAAPRPTRAALAGAALGALHLAKTTLPFAGPLLALALLAGRGGWKAQLGRAAAAAAAFLLVASPLLARNAARDAPLLHNEGFSHFMVVAFNHPGADGVHQVWPETEYFRRVLGRSEPAGTSVLRSALAEFERPADFVRLEATKLRAFWSGYEPRGILVFHDMWQVLEALHLFPILSVALLPLALAGGLGSLGPPLRRLWPLHVGLGLVLLTCLAAAPLDRYRLVAVPYLAGLAAWAGFALLRGGRRRLLLAALTLLGAAAAWPVGEVAPPLHAARRRVGMVYTEVGDVRRATRHALLALEAHPLSAAPPAGLREMPTDPDWREFLALHSWAHDMARQAGDAAAVARVEASLRRHVAPAGPR